MTHIALYHSVLGVRPGITDAADRLSAAGHQVRLVDQYAGRVFDDYDEASSFAEWMGYPALMAMAEEAVADLPDGFLAVGFSNGGGMAEHVATRRPVGGVVMLSGALALDMLGVSEWPAGVPAQIHYSEHDPFRRQEWVDDVAAAVIAAGGDLQRFDYPGSGHLFTDASLAGEYDAESAARLWQRVIDFCDRPPAIALSDRGSARSVAVSAVRGRAPGSGGRSWPRSRRSRSIRPSGPPRSGLARCRR